MHTNNGWGGRWQNGGSRWNQGYGVWKGSYEGGGYYSGGKGGGGNPFRAMMQSVNEVGDFRAFIADAAGESSGSPYGHNPNQNLYNHHAPQTGPPPSADASQVNAVSHAADNIISQLVQRVTENLTQQQQHPSAQLSTTMNQAFGAVNTKGAAT